MSRNLQQTQRELFELKNEYETVKDNEFWLKRTNQDVYKHLQLALMQIEELQGHLLAGHPITEEEFTGDADAQGVISQRLVAFKNIVELQEKNIELLEIVRRLSEDKEELEYEERRLKYAELRH